MKEFTNIDDFYDFVNSYSLCKKCKKPVNGQYKIDGKLYCAECHRKIKGDINETG